MSETQQIVVRYKTTTEAAEENQRLVEAVYAELAAERPAGISYSTYRLEDNTFLHVFRNTRSDNPLAALPAFQAFQERIAERCEDGPTPMTATLVGSYTGLEAP